MPGSTPLVSVIIPTRNRPLLLPIALACFNHQTYPNRELIVVDDGDVPIDEHAVAAVGGRVLRLPPGTPLGDKLNHGIQYARGTLIQRMDDDDWYATDFMHRLVNVVLDQRLVLCRPVIAGMVQRLFFDIAAWNIRRSRSREVTGMTFLFHRADWAECPFRPITRGEDTWFVADHIRMRGINTAIAAGESVIVIRHGQHTWTHVVYGPTVEDRMQAEWPRHDQEPEDMFSEWALARYRAIRETLVT